MECHGCQARAKEAGRYPEDDREWNFPAFIKSCQGQEYEEHAEREGIYGLTARFTFLRRGFDKFEAIPIRKDLIGSFFERIKRLPGGIPVLLLPADLDRREVVVTRDDRDSIGFLRSDEGGNRHHIALIVTDRQELVILRVRAVLGIRLRNDLEVTSINGEVIDLDRAIVGLKGGEDITDSHTISLCFFSINIIIVGWCIASEGGVGHLDFRTLVCCAEEFSDDALEFFIRCAALVHDVKAEAAGGAKAWNRRLIQRHQRYIRMGRPIRHGFAHDGIDLFVWRFTFIPRFQFDEGKACIWFLPAGQNIKAGDALRLFDRRIFSHIIKVISDGCIRSDIDRAFGQRERRDKEAVIFLRQECRRQLEENTEGCDRDDDKDDDRGSDRMSHLLQDRPIDFYHMVETIIESIPESIEEAFPILLLRRLQEAGAERRSQRQRDESRNQDRDSDGESKLFVQDTHDPAKESNRYENRSQNDRYADNRALYLLHRSDSRLFRAHVVIAHFILDGFYDDDRIIDDQPDG